MKSSTALKLVASIALAAVPLTVWAADQSHTNQPQTICQPALQQTRTDFPLKSQQLGEHGVVQIQVRLGVNGRATAVAIAQSSGYTALDRAAADSVRKYWQFDVTQCAADQLQASYDVNVLFERAVSYTLSNTIDRNALARSRELASSNRCQVVEDSVGTKVFSCAPVGNGHAVERDAKVSQ